MIKAQFDTPNFTFEAYGSTTSHAVNALKRGLAQHAADYDLDPDWWHKWEDDIQVIYIEFNKAYRDLEPLKVLT